MYIADRKIRFEDDDTRDPSEPEKDTRLKFKPAVSALQVKMLRLAGQEVPMVPESSVTVSTLDNNNILIIHDKPYKLYNLSSWCDDLKHKYTNKYNTTYD